jgi:hypothetical protein
MKKFFRIFSVAALIILLSANSGFSQKISNIDFDLVKKKTQDKSSSYYYPVLIKRFINGDSTLKAQDYGYIYYGYVFSEYYNPYGESEKEKLFAEAYKNAEFGNAILLGEEALFTDPVNPGILFKLLICYDQMGKKAKAKEVARRYFNIIQCIYASGDGKSGNTAYVVIRVADEREVTDDMDLKVLKQTLMTGNIDRIEMEYPNEKDISELYFNVSKPMLFLDVQPKK